MGGGVAEVKRGRQDHPCHPKVKPLDSTRAPFVTLETLACDQTHLLQIEGQMDRFARAKRVCLRRRGMTKIDPRGGWRMIGPGIGVRVYARAPWARAMVFPLECRVGSGQ